MNKNIIPSLDDVSKLTEQEFIIKYNGCKFESEAEAKVYRKLYDLTKNDCKLQVICQNGEANNTSTPITLTKDNVNTYLSKVFNN